MFETVGAPCLCVVALRKHCTGIIMIEFLFVLNFAFLSFDIVSACPGAMCLDNSAAQVSQVWARDFDIRISDLCSTRKNTNFRTKELCVQRADVWLKVHNRRSIHSIQSTNLEDWPIDIKYIYQTQAKGVRTVRTSSRKDPSFRNSRVSPGMDSEGLAVCHVEPAQDEKLISGLNTVQALQGCFFYDQLSLHTGRSALMWCLMSLF